MNNKEDKALDLAYEALIVIANVGVGNGGWKTQSPEWITAAERWRDKFHKALEGEQ